MRLQPWSSPEPPAPPPEGGRVASVALLLRHAPELELLWILRARNPKDPWSGNMGFPGGRAEPEDRNPQATAIRETAEEIGFDLREHAHFLGPLRPIRTRPELPQLQIHPFVFELKAGLEPSFERDPREVEETLWVPLSFLVDPNNRRTEALVPDYPESLFDCFRYRDRYVIWGLSLRMAEDLLSTLAWATSDSHPFRAGVARDPCRGHPAEAPQRY